MVSSENQLFKVLIQQHDMTGANRRWAARYAVADVLRFSRGNRGLGIDHGSYAQVIAANMQENLLTVQIQGGETAVNWSEHISRDRETIRSWRSASIHGTRQGNWGCQPRTRHRRANLT